MTSILWKQSTEFPTMRFMGHAGSGPYGGDLVCAAVSTLAGTLAAALEDRGIEAETRQAEGDVTITARPTERQREACGIIYETAKAGAQLLEKKYPEYVTVMRM